MLRVAANKDALRPILDAINTNSPSTVKMAVKIARGLNSEDAVFAMHHAYIRDLNTGRSAAHQMDSGLMFAVFRGLHLAQSEMHGMSEKEIASSNNAVTTLASAAAKYDDPRLIEMLIRWEPGFTMAALHEEGPVSNAQTTADFFLDMSAPRCAAWTRANHPDGCLAHQEEATLKRQEARLRKEANVWMRRLRLKNANTANDTAAVGLRRVMLHTTRLTGEVHVLEHTRSVFTIGMCLLGLPELMHVARPEDDVDELCASMRSAAMNALLGKPPERDTSVSFGNSTTLVQVVAPFSSLRKNFRDSVWSVRL